MAAMVPSPPHHHIQQLASMLCNKSMLLKLENIIVFTMYFLSYFKARCIIDAPCLSVCGLHQRAALRVSYSQREMLSACAESMIVSAPPAESMILLAPFDSVITYYAMVTR
jgi:hypothetical protein